MDRALQEAWAQTPPLWRHPAPAGQVPPRRNHTFHTSIQDVCGLEPRTAISQSCLSPSLPTLGMVTGRAVGRACPRVLISVVTVIAGVCACVQPPPLQTSAPPPGGQMHTQGHHPHYPTLCQCLVGTTLVSGLLAQCLSARPGAQHQTQEDRVSQGANAASAGAQVQVLALHPGRHRPRRRLFLSSSQGLGWAVCGPLLC